MSTVTKGGAGGIATCHQGKSGEEGSVQVVELVAECVDHALELVRFDLLLAAGRRLLLGEERREHRIVRKLHEDYQVT